MNLESATGTGTTSALSGGCDSPGIHKPRRRAGREPDEDHRQGSRPPHDLPGYENIVKRLLVLAGGLNLGLVMRQLIGLGTPRTHAVHAQRQYAVNWSWVKSGRRRPSMSTRSM